MRPNPRPSQILHGQPGKALELYEQVPPIHREVGMCRGSDHSLQYGHALT